MAAVRREGVNHGGWVSNCSTLCVGVDHGTQDATCLSRADKDDANRRVGIASFDGEASAAAFWNLSSLISTGKEATIIPVV